MTDDSETDIWASPTNNDAPRPRTPRTPKTPKTPAGHEGSAGSNHEAALRKELEGVRNVNRAIEGVIATLERTGGNMNVVTNTVSNASTLLNTWTRILSQTEHNQRLILHPNWKGLTEDLAAQEAESIARQQAAERRAAEEEQRREELRRRREEEEEKRRLIGSSGTRGTRGTSGIRGTRGRVRAASRAGTTTSSYGAGRGTSSAFSSRGTSGIGRGTGTSTARGRARGTR